MNAAEIPLDIPIVYQDHYLLLVNKPAGLVIHPTYKHTDNTMWNMLLAYFSRQAPDNWQPPELPDEPEWIPAPPHIREMLREKRRERQWREEGTLPRPCLLHRLDKDTSGIVVLARTEKSRQHIIRQFEERTIVKRYLAVVREGAPEWAHPQKLLRGNWLRQDGDAQDVAPAFLIDLPQGDTLLLDGPLQRDPGDRRRCIVGVEGQEARTRLRVMGREQGYMLLEVQPVPGRTHQIRAHLAAAGFAIVGDQTYAPPARDDIVATPLRRQFLHAYSLTLRSYPENRVRQFVAPLAEDLQHWLQVYVPTLYTDYLELVGRSGQDHIDAREISGK